MNSPKETFDLLDSHGIFRIVKDLCVAELTQSRRVPSRLPSGSPSSELLDQTELWTRATVLLERHNEGGGHCLHLDSLERISIAASMNQFFRLYDWGVEDNLLRQKTLGELADLVAAVLLDEREPWRALTVLSSGSTGDPKRISHQREALGAECESWKTLLPGARRVLSLVPSHHLYGLIWSVLWPSAAGIPSIDARAWGPGRWQRELAAGDVIVAVPLQWEMMIRSLGSAPVGVTGISSAGTLPEALWDGVKGLGLGRMIEVYGSTETGGVATREAFGQSYRLAGHWRDRGETWSELLPDEIALQEDGSFRVLGRKDGGVKVAGSLVYPSVVERAMLELPGVEDVRVRHTGTEDRARLEALVITPLPEGEHARLELEITRALAEKFAAASIPRRYSFRGHLPTNEMGKVVAW